MWKGETREGREQFPATGAKLSYIKRGRTRKGEGKGGRVAGTIMMSFEVGKEEEEERKPGVSNI
jgi:hypothetical protein